MKIHPITTFLLAISKNILKFSFLLLAMSSLLNKTTSFITHTTIQYYVEAKYKKKRKKFDTATSRNFGIEYHHPSHFSNKCIFINTDFFPFLCVLYSSSST